MQSVFQLAMLIPVTVLAVCWIVLALKYEDKFKEITATIDSSEYFMCELFHIGFQIMQIIRYDMKSERARRKIKMMAEVYGKKYAEYHYYVLIGGQITYLYTAVTGILLIALLANEPMAVLFGIVLAGLFVWYLSETFKDKLTARREKILSDFPQVLSKLTLLVNSGMLLRDAWNLTAEQGNSVPHLLEQHAVSLTAEQGNSVLFEEMRQTALQMANGVPESTAYYEFAERCGVKEIRKFSSMIIQGLEKGGSDLTKFLKDMSEEMWMEKKNLVKQKGEKANAKLLIPTTIIFIGILLMIMAPVLTGL